MRRKLIYIIIVLNIWYFDSALGHARSVICHNTRGEFMSTDCLNVRYMNSGMPLDVWVS